MRKHDDERKRESRPATRHYRRQCSKVASRTPNPTVRSSILWAFASHRQLNAGTSTGCAPAFSKTWFCNR